MTHNQISFWEYKEEQRHNLVQERYQDSYLRYQERTLAESIRHNKQQELLGFKSLDETIRHNKANEGIGWGNIQLGYAQLSETQRHNRVTESNQLLSISESMRHNLASEAQARANWIVDYGQLQLGQKKVAISERDTGVRESTNTREWLKFGASVAKDVFSFPVDNLINFVDAIIPG